jgi:hypothetical protein
MLTISARAVRVLLASAVLAVVLAGTSAYTLTIKPGPEPQYTVASSSKDLEGAGAGPVVVPRTSRVRGLSENLTLVAVGGLLLGLAAAVRRTT